MGTEILSEAIFGIKYFLTICDTIKIAVVYPFSKPNGERNLGPRVLYRHVTTQRID